MVKGIRKIPHLLAGVGWLSFSPSPLKGAGVSSGFSAEHPSQPMSYQQLDQINIAKAGSHMDGRLTLNLLWVETCLSGDQKLCNILKVILCS